MTPRERPRRIAVGHAARHHTPPPRATPRGPRVARGSDAPHPTPATKQAQAKGAGEIAGLVVGAAERSGEDVRRRGWFWHWNNLVTQYAPLIGLKGIGLLNSYTVWTDRREESPHRGYAFPSQQREADFYGEDRAELIAINKLLVLLDLIEIRKEMTVRPDEQGRRWRVPHNFYRVKDHGDGFSLTARDVLRVAELAERDRAVYRYVRRVFSPRFAPIDGDNVWHAILPEVRQTEVWQRLAARAAREEEAASARTRAGHAARKGGLGMPEARDTAASNDSDSASDRGASDRGEQTAVARTNKGSGPVVAPGNSGAASGVAGSNDASPPHGPTSVAPANGGGPSAVGPTNTTYDQSTLTTTTTTTSTAGTASTARRDGGTAGRRKGGKDRALAPAAPAAANDTLPGPIARATEVPNLQPDAPLSLEHPTPDDIGVPPSRLSAAPPHEAAVAAFAAANSRPASALERELLAALAAQFDAAARAGGAAAGQSGWEWVTAAIYEAVEAGSAFVAPRRLREILTRWERDGATTRTARTARTARRPGGKAEGGRREGGEDIARFMEPTPPATAAPSSPSPIPHPPSPEPEEAAPPGFVVAECGLPSGQVWPAVLEEARTRGKVSATDYAAWLRATALLGRDAATGGLIVGVSHALAQRRVATRFLAPLRAAVAAVVGADLPLTIVVTRDWLRGAAAPSVGAAAPRAGHSRG